MDDNKPHTYRTDQSNNKLPESSHEDHSCEEITSHDSPNLQLESERGAPRSDAASDSKAASADQLLSSSPTNLQGVKSSNTTPTNLQSPILSTYDTPPSLPLSTGGLDWLSLSIYGTFEELRWEEIYTTFDIAQTHAQNNEEENSFVNLSSDVSVPIAPSGKATGVSHCRWKFQYQGIKVGIRHSRKALVSENDPPNVYVDISSLPLMTYGEKNVIQLVSHLLDLLGYEVERMSPSRVDMCVDLVDIPMNEIADAYRKGCYVTKTRKSGTYANDRDIETIKFGSPQSQTSLRIYDKYIESNSDLLKRDLLLKLRWGKEPNPELGAIRVEFQIRRDHLRDRHSIITYEDLINKRHSLARYLTYDWFRITESEPDPNHTERYSASALWQRVTDAFTFWTGPLIEERMKREVIGSDPSRLIAQAIGCLISAIATKGKCPKSVDELKAILSEILESHCPKMVNDIAVKRKLLEATQPFLVVTK